MRILLTAVLILAIAASSTQAATFTGTYSSSNAWTGWQGKCTDTAQIYGAEPDDTATHPVLVYTMGTLGVYNGAEAAKIVQTAATMGFVAVSANYDSLWQFSTFGATNQARCIYGPRNSAAAFACARPRADCTKGVVVAGFSQGGVIANKAKNFEPRVRAAWLMGFNDLNTGSIDHSPPLGTRALANNEIRLIPGEAQDVTTPALRDGLNRLAGTSCDPNGWTCLRPDGSGWRVVRNSEVADGVADHCYMHGAGGCNWFPPFDPNWLNPATAEWSLTANLAWLQSRTG